MNDTYILDIFKLISTPFILVSGLGIYVLGLNARYAHIVNLLRSTLKEQNKNSTPDTSIKEEIYYLKKRSYLIKYSLGLLVLSVICSSILIFLQIIHHIVINIPILNTITILSLLMSLFLIILSMIFLLFDIYYSLKATSLTFKK